MSIHISTWVQTHSDARLADRLVLLILADNANEETWSCWPSVGNISERTRLDERTVQRSIRSLESNQRLEVQIGAGENGRNIYTILRSSPFDRVGRQIATPGIQCDKGAANNTDRGGKYDKKQPSFLGEPELEPSDKTVSIPPGLGGGEQDLAPGVDLPPVALAPLEPPRGFWQGNPVKALDEAARSLGLPKLRWAGKTKSQLKDRDDRLRRDEQNPGAWEQFRTRLWEALCGCQEDPCRNRPEDAVCKICANGYGDRQNGSVAARAWPRVRRTPPEATVPTDPTGKTPQKAPSGIILIMETAARGAGCAVTDSTCQPAWVWEELEKFWLLDQEGFTKRAQPYLARAGAAGFGWSGAIRAIWDAEKEHRKSFTARDLSAKRVEKESIGFLLEE